MARLQQGHAPMRPSHAVPSKVNVCECLDVAPLFLQPAPLLLFARTRACNVALHAQTQQSLTGAKCHVIQDMPQCVHTEHAGLFTQHAACAGLSSKAGDQRVAGAHQAGATPDATA